MGRHSGEQVVADGRPVREPDRARRLIAGLDRMVGEVADAVLPVKAELIYIHEATYQP